MATRMRCLKCSKIIECSPYDTSILLQHIKTDHPDFVLAYDEKMDFEDSTNPNRNNSRASQQRPSGNNIMEEGPAKSSSRPNLTEGRESVPRVQLPTSSENMGEESVRSSGQKPMYTRKYNVHRPQTPQKSPQRRRMYKTSIEKWRPAKGVIYCPKCGTKKVPIIRSTTEKLSYSTVGAACILTCWPLCFLPCLFPAPEKNYLHCSECNNFLGMFDKQKNCVRPNREFVEEGDDNSKCVTDGRASQSMDKPPECNEEKRGSRCSGV